MSIVPPPITPVQIPSNIIDYRPVSSITPFTYRSGMTYQALLEALRVYATETLTDYFFNEFTGTQDAWKENLDALILAVNTALDEQAEHVSTELADTLAEILAGANNNLNDALILNALKLAGSTSLAYLDARYDGRYDAAGAAATVGQALNTATTVLTARENVSPAPTGADDTTSLQTWLNALPARASARIRSGAYIINGTLTIPAGVALTARGAKFTGAGSSAKDLFVLGSDSWLIGAEVTFTRPGGRPVLISNVARARVVDCYIHDIAGVSVNDGPGIRAEAGATKYLIRNNIIERVNGQGIALDFASLGTVEGNFIDQALHGIQWWGGDSASSNTISIEHIIIANNRVRNVQGGIWGSLGRYITVSANEVDNCNDVGIDFEGCSDSTAVGNTVQRCVNACLGVFYGSFRCTFSGNTCDNAGFSGPCFKAFTNEMSQYIEVVDNMFNTDTGPAISTDQRALGDSSVRGNRILCLTQGVMGMRILECTNISIQQNTMRVASPTGISFEGGSDSRIENNEILTLLDGSAVGANSGGVLLYWRSSDFPCKRNRVRNNVIRGFVQAVFDNCWNDLNSATLIENNVATRITTRNGSSVQVFNNRTEGTHVPVTPTTI